MAEKKYYTWMGIKYEDYYFNLETLKAEIQKQVKAGELCQYCEYTFSSCRCCTEPPWCNETAYCIKCRTLNEETVLEKMTRESRYAPKKEISPIAKRKLRFF